ncbi:LIM domain only protein 3-like isoform X1 [Coccinella septempunctata]|uniref:LIM domain only protein 3-like isoform X1 n=2 Tax=Coccinella septempunctata TaxID=41139 RepID=UPI001D0983DE|nr:LIM domain only protein 3-like isoform X1 [Coccinella septempunctata]
MDYFLNVVSERPPTIKSRPNGPMMTMDVSKSEAPKPGTNTGQQECAGCCKPITERYLLKALDLYWHEDCLKCGCCDCRLGEVGSTLYTKANLILCKRDYLRLFGNTGYCAACTKVIPAFEMVMRARNNVYHLECFACQQCNHRFCVGDRFYLCENKILCEYDYEERLVFANMAYNPPPLSHLKRQTSIPPTPLPNHLINGHRTPLPPSNGDHNNNMSGNGPLPPSSMANSPFSVAGHLKNPPMSLGATS